jgi:LysM repeat protein
MIVKVGAGVVALIVAALFLNSFVFGGGEEDEPSVTRPGSIPTATPPANLPEPVLLGEATGTGGGGTSPGTGGATGGNTYVVKSGDTLFGIAAQLNVPAGQQASWVAEVLRLNGLADASLLRAGQELRVPATTGATPAATTGAASGTATPQRTATSAPASTNTPSAAAPTATPRATVTGGGGTYTVVSGDYPLLIAEKLGIAQSLQAAWVDQLVALNGINPASLSVGQVLQLPAGVTNPATATNVPTVTPNAINSLPTSTPPRP